MEVAAKCSLIVLFSINRPNYSCGYIVQFKTNLEETEKKNKYSKSENVSVIKNLRNIDVFICGSTG